MATRSVAPLSSARAAIRPGQRFGVHQASPLVEAALGDQPLDRLRDHPADRQAGARRARGSASRRSPPAASRPGRPRPVRRGVASFSSTAERSNPGRAATADRARARGPARDASSDRGRRRRRRPSRRSARSLEAHRQAIQAYGRRRTGPRARPRGRRRAARAPRRPRRPSSRAAPRGPGSGSISLCGASPVGIRISSSRPRPDDGLLGEQQVADVRRVESAAEDADGSAHPRV